MLGKLILKDNTELEGLSFGARRSVSGEVVFATGMVGYPESLTDPSYRGQILAFTYPLVGNYGVPEKKFWESQKIQVSALIVSNYIDTPSHYTSKRTLSQWLIAENVPALEIKDTRALTKKLREFGVMLGRITPSFISPSRGGERERVVFKDPNERNLVAEVSTNKVQKVGTGRKKIIVIDCGVKQNIVRELVNRRVEVTVVPWDYDVFAENLKFDSLVISNGPGDPKMAGRTIAITKKALELKVPILGICLGNQILTLAAGGDTYKLKFGHRGQNHDAILMGTKRNYLTTQNHGYAVGRIPPGFKPWFINANDRTNEGIIHKTLPFMSVQFHPESHPGPLDTGWIFDEFLRSVPSPGLGRDKGRGRTHA